MYVNLKMLMHICKWLTSILYAYLGSLVTEYVVKVCLRIRSKMLYRIPSTANRTHTNRARDATCRKPTICTRDIVEELKSTSTYNKIHKYANIGQIIG